LESRVLAFKNKAALLFEPGSVESRPMSIRALPCVPLASAKRAFMPAIRECGIAHIRLAG